MDALNVSLRDLPNWDTFPYISEPMRIGAFSINMHRWYRGDFDGLRYFVKPKQFPINLSENCSKATRKSNLACTEYLDHLLRFIHQNGGIDAMQRRYNMNVICFRDVLQLIMCTPYDKQNWCLLVTHYNGVIYITKQEDLVENSDRMQQALLTSWWYKLKQHCLSPDPQQKPNPTQNIDECTEFNCVFVTQIGDFNLLYAADICGIKSKTKIDPSDDVTALQFIELRTRLKNMTRKQWSVHNSQATLIWWCQCFLIGVDDVFVALHDENGVAHDIEATSMRTMRKDCEVHWKAGPCGNFLLDFLKTVKAIVAEVNSPSIVFAFGYNSNTGKISYTKYEPRNEHTFIPDWYHIGN